MRQINVYKVSERQPLIGEYVYPLAHNNLYCQSYIEEPAKVEYTWLVIDENGEDTGNQYVFDQNEKQPPHTRLAILGNDGYELDGNTEYILADDVSVTKE